MVGSINLRLQQARKEENLSVRALHERLLGQGLDYSYSSARNYEDSTEVGDQRARMPPADYVAGVAKVCNVRVEWLLFGDEPMRGGELTEAEADDRNFEKALFDEATVAILRDVKWLKVSQLRFAFLHLLADCRRAITKRQEDAKEGGLADFLARFFSFPFEVAGGDQWLTRPHELPSRERHLVALHLASLIRILFRPFREDEISFVWSRALTRSDATASEAAAEPEREPEPQPEHPPEPGTEAEPERRAYGPRKGTDRKGATKKPRKRGKKS